MHRKAASHLQCASWCTSRRKLWWTLHTPQSCANNTTPSTTTSLTRMFDCCSLNFRKWQPKWQVDLKGKPNEWSVVFWTVSLWRLSYDKRCCLVALLIAYNCPVSPMKCIAQFILIGSVFYCGQLGFFTMFPGYLYPIFYKDPKALHNFIIYRFVNFQTTFRICIGIDRILYSCQTQRVEVNVASEGQ